MGAMKCSESRGSSPGWRRTTGEEERPRKKKDSDFDCATRGGGTS